MVSHIHSFVGYAPPVGSRESVRNGRSSHPSRIMFRAPLLGQGKGLGDGWSVTSISDYVWGPYGGQGLYMDSLVESMLDWISSLLSLRQDVSVLEKITGMNLRVDGRVTSTLNMVLPPESEVRVG